MTNPQAPTKAGLPDKLELVGSVALLDDQSKRVCTLNQSREDRRELGAELVRRYNAHEALIQYWLEGECYCADNVAAKGPCAHCIVKAALAAVE